MLFLCKVGCGRSPQRRASDAHFGVLSRKVKTGVIDSYGSLQILYVHNLQVLKLQVRLHTNSHNTMAGDTRDSSTPPPRGSPPGATEPPDHVKNTKVYEVFNGPPNANSLPEGSGQNTAGSHQEAPSLGEAVKTVRLGDFQQVYLYPCVRESLLTGIGAGFGMGAVRAVWGSMYSLLSNLRLSIISNICDPRSVSLTTLNL